jgi:hypothetical protein
LNGACVTAVLTIRAWATVGTLSAGAAALCTVIIETTIRISAAATHARRLTESWYRIAFLPTLAVGFDIDLHIRSSSRYRLSKVHRCAP